MAGMVPFRRDPLSGMRSLFDGFFNEDFFSGMLPDFHGGFKADVRETEKEYIVEADLPGMDKDQIELSLNDDILTVKANRSEEKNEEREGFIRKERYNGVFQRSFLVEGVKRDHVEASYDNGVLKVVLPKDEGARTSRKIDIH
jgi:HSP20 family protein